jgi:hypothetical protein
MSDVQIMKGKEKGIGNAPGDPAARQRLVELRDALLALHKTLIDSERIGYEGTFGPIGPPANFLKLLMQDPWFAWLRPLSAFITSIDEALDGKEPITKAGADEFSKVARQMLAPEETGEGFGRQYFEALQRDPDVVMAHGSVMKLKKI